MTFDIHNHWLPELYIENARKKVYGESVTVEKRDDKEFLAFPSADGKNTAYMPIMSQYYDLEQRFEDMKEENLDMAAISNLPFTFHYGVDPKLAYDLHQMLNDKLADLVNKYPEKFKGLANVTLQDVGLAVKELKRAVKDLGLSGVQIGSNVRGDYLGDEKFLPFWEEANELGAVVLIHPIDVAGFDRMKDFYLRNLIGNLLDTTISASSIIFSGLFEKFNNLKICLSHSGGQLNFIAGRLDRGFEVRSECKTISNPPSYYLRSFYHDTITHHSKALEYVISVVGADRIVLGTDYPFDMGAYNIVDFIDGLQISNEDKELIKSKNIKNIFVDL